MDDWNNKAPQDENAPQPLRRARRDLPFEGKSDSVQANEFSPQSIAETSSAEFENPTEKSDEGFTPTSPEKKSAISLKTNGSEEALPLAANAFDWIKSFLFSLAAVIFIFTLIFRGVTVSGGSMLPTLEDTEYLIISDLFYTPKTGDIVVVQSPTYKNGTEPLIKRVIATGGQTLKINFDTWQVWVDGVELEENYVAYEEGISMNSEDMEPNEEGIVEIVVDEGCIFVMGDHRNDSLDSRSHAVGQIDERYIMGRVMIRVTPISKFGKVA